MTKKIIIILLFILAFYFFNKKVLADNSITENNEKIYPSSIKISNSPKQLKKIGQEYQLEVNFNPTNTTEKEITWSSSDNNILSVNQNGKIIAKKQGTVKITATTTNGKSDSIAVTIKESNNSTSKNNTNNNIVISNVPKEMLKGETIILKIKNGNTELKNEDLKFESSNNKVLSIYKNGIIKAVGKGTATITVTSSNGKYAKAKINVKNIKISLDSNNININKGDSKDIIATIESVDKINNKNVNWTSSSTSNVTISKSENQENQIKVTVNAKNVGKSKIKISINDEDAFVNVNVIDSNNNELLQCPKITYNTNDNSQIEMKIEPDEKTVKWDYYTSTNKKTGSNATFKKQKTFDNKDTTIITSPYTEAQGKIRIYDIEGKTKDCYTAPFDLDQTKKSDITITYNNNIICPNLNYTNEKYSNENEYTVKFNSNKIITGIKKVSINIQPVKDQNYQYTWYSNKGENIYQIYRTFNNKTKTSLTMDKNYNRQGIILTMDENGDTKSCKTNIYSNIIFNKKEIIKDTNVLIEKNYQYDINEMIEYIKNFPYSNLTASEIFFLTEESYHKLIDESNNSCSKIYDNNLQIFIRDGLGCDNDWTKYSLTHALGHSIDNMYKKLNEDYISNNYEFVKLYNKYKNNNNFLSAYSYINPREFFADLFSIYYINNKNNDSNLYKKIYIMNNELENQETEILKEIDELYKNNKDEWNNIKKSYQ